MGLLDEARQLFQPQAATPAHGARVPGRPGAGWAGLPTAVPAYGQSTAVPAASPVTGDVPAGDRAAVDRYRYLLRTAPPEQVEQVHTEAFARLTPGQRRQVLQGLAPEVPLDERIAAADDPQSLARMATRAEMRRPGTLERVFSAGGTGAGATLAGGLLAGVAAAVVGSVLIDGLVDTGFGDSGLLDVGGFDSPVGLGGFDGAFDF